jgi:ATP-dependent DNA helicase RecG
MALIAYGDLAVSALRDAPPGRQKLHTYHVSDTDHARWWDFCRKQLQQGRQGYVIVPRLSVDEETDLSGLEQEFEALAHGELSAFRLGWLHGRMSIQEKLDSMQEFRSRKSHVLVATSVVEIGVDVPNATIMTIQNADRFGLAQLHQLRGRVARGKFPGYVGLFGRPSTAEAEARMKAITSTCDGFELAELDLKQRGPGDFFGARQHGIATFRVARVPEDADLLLEARQAAEELLEEDPELVRPEHAGLRRQMERRYGESMELGHVG